MKRIRVSGFGETIFDEFKSAVRSLYPNSELSLSIVVLVLTIDVLLRNIFYMRSTHE